MRKSRKNRVSMPGLVFFFVLLLLQRRKFSMIVFKFGGASVKDAAAVRNMAGIVNAHNQRPLVVVVSAMGKTTNAIENYANLCYHGQAGIQEAWEVIRDYHLKIIHGLFGEKPLGHSMEATQLLEELRNKPAMLRGLAYDEYYDQLVSLGEMLSTAIISAWLRHTEVNHTLLDARKLISTDSNFREAGINWEPSREAIRAATAGEGLYLTQGFIGSCGKATTTLGREGSDFSAAIIAWATNAHSLTIWKDVPGLLNADPKQFTETQKLDHISYNEAIELAYYGATIIHPNTIKPLQNKNIPLYVKSFADYSQAGSCIDKHSKSDHLIPSFILKFNQILVSISPRDFSFIVEQNISTIFSLLADLNIKVNLMQNSAISFSICIDLNEKTDTLISRLQSDYRVRYNTGLELITIRHYSDNHINNLVRGRKVLLEQKSRATCQMVVKSSSDV